MDESSLSNQFEALSDRIDLIWANHEREHRQHDLAHGREHEFAQKAIETAALLAKENKADANEWRATMNDRERTFATKGDAASILDRLSKFEERERTFATKSDVAAVLDRLDKIERADILVAERERARVLEDAEERRQSERRQARQQWQVGLLIGVMATGSAILVNLILRLLS